MMRSVLETYAVARAMADPSRSLAEILPSGVEIAACRGEARFYHGPGVHERHARSVAWNALLAARKARAASRARAVRSAPIPEGAA
ncbi:hypothetical protein ACQ5SO_17110 [Rhodovulum sp. DZ06]|uniref:hypothetical protein n=1 Tax=Rhodovulum sp. DZ06 TaxID=3425126 RepID=UPI003D32F19C